MKTRQILIDNETFDITPSAVLLTIGAVAVEIEDGHATVLARWYRRLLWRGENHQAGRTSSRATIDWWIGQSDAAYEEAIDENGNRLPLWLAVQSLAAWLQLNPYPIWGNGSEFDNAQLQHAFNQHGLRWPYWRNRCLRSLRGLVLDLYPGTGLPSFPADKIKHHALHDAEHEADVLAVLLDTIVGHKTIGTLVDDVTEKNWTDFWEPIIRPDNGAIDLGQIKRELHDYSTLLREVPRVYMHVTGGKVSKPHTDSDVVIAIHDDHVTELISGATGEAA